MSASEPILGVCLSLFNIYKEINAENIYLEIFKKFVIKYTIIFEQISSKIGNFNR
jgi:hypothetical protein